MKQAVLCGFLALVAAFHGVGVIGTATAPRGPRWWFNVHIALSLAAIVMLVWVW